MVSFVICPVTTIFKWWIHQPFINANRMFLSILLSCRNSMLTLRGYEFQEREKKSEQEKCSYCESNQSKFRMLRNNKRRYLSSFTSTLSMSMRGRYGTKGRGQDQLCTTNSCSLTGGFVTLPPSTVFLCSVTAEK